jgi:hypothetical protein
LIKFSHLRQKSFSHPEHALDVDVKTSVPVIIATIEDGPMMNPSKNGYAKKCIQWNHFSKAIFLLNRG